MGCRRYLRGAVFREGVAKLDDDIYRRGGWGGGGVRSLIFYCWGMMGREGRII